MRYYQGGTMTDVNKDFFNLKAVEIKEVSAKLKEAIVNYAKLDDDKQYSQEGLKLSEDFFMFTNMLLETPDNSGAQAVTSLMEEFLKNKKMAEFDILNNTMIELMSSGYTDDGHSTPYTLVWLAVSLFKNNGKFELDGFESIIQSSFFHTQITSAIDDVIMVPQLLPSNFQEKIGIKEIYDFTSMHFEKVHSAQFPQEVLDRCGQKEEMKEDFPTFYLPVFVKGMYDDVIEAIYENAEKLSEQFAENLQLILNRDDIVFHSPVDLVDASKENASKVVNYGKLMAFFTMVASQNNPSTEICVLRVADEPNSYVILYLDKSDSSVNRLLVIENEDSYIDFMTEVIEFLQEKKFPLLLIDGKITRKLLTDIIENCSPGNETEFSEKAQNSLIHLFNSSMDVDKNELYQLLTCSTLTIH